MRTLTRKHKRAFAEIILAVLSMLAVVTAGQANAELPWPDPCPGCPRVR